MCDENDHVVLAETVCPLPYGYTLYPVLCSVVWNPWYQWYPQFVYFYPPCNLTQWTVHINWCACWLHKVMDWGWSCHCCCHGPLFLCAVCACSSFAPTLICIHPQGFILTVFICTCPCSHSFIHMCSHVPDCKAGSGCLPGLLLASPLLLMLIHVLASCHLCWCALSFAFAFAFVAVMVACSCQSSPTNAQPCTGEPSFVYACIRPCPLAHCICIDPPTCLPVHSFMLKLVTTHSCLSSLICSSPPTHIHPFTPTCGHTCAGLHSHSHLLFMLACCSTH